MKKVPPNRVRSHADFDLTPLGMWADRGDAALMPGARHFQYHTCLPNPFASDGLGEVGTKISRHRSRQAILTVWSGPSAQSRGGTALAQASTHSAFCADCDC